MIQDGLQSVLIDALHGPYSEYFSPPPKQLKAMQMGDFPYNGSEVILVTHVHRDHFDPQIVGLHLEHNQNAVLVGPQEVANALKDQFEGYKRVRAQIRTVTPRALQRETITMKGVRIEVLGLRHGGDEFRTLEHVGYVVHLGHWALLHVGDAEDSKNNFMSFNLNREDIDVAFLPFWFLLTSEKQALVGAQIRPQHIVAVHIPSASASELEEASKDMRAGFPHVTIFNTLMEKKSFWK